MTIRSRTFALSALAALVVSSAFATDANACGGCFPPPDSESTVVTGHRMAFSISPTQTVLWDQIEYTGSPTEFAWVLPIKKGARIELASDAWFEALDAATGTRVFGPPANCFFDYGGDYEGGSGCGCAQYDSAEAGAPRSDVGQQDPVTVVKRESVGPYDAITLSTDVPGVLTDWLQMHGYALPDTIKPVIDAYTAEGFDFIALRLSPGQGVQNMKPVRVVSPGASPVLPLRMVAAGTGANTAMTVYIIGEGRWEAKNFPNVKADPADLTWDYATSSSDYADKRLALLAGDNGRTWLTAFAKPNVLLSPVASDAFMGLPVQYQADPTSPAVSTIAELWVQAGRVNAEALDSACVTSMLGWANSNDLVVDTCNGGGGGMGGAGGAGGAGGMGGSGGMGGMGMECGAVDFGQIDARSFNCVGPTGEFTFDDLGVALTGMHPSSVWVTRLEANLSRVALELDLEMQAADQTSVDNWLQTGKSKGEACTGAAVAKTPDDIDAARERRNRRETAAVCALFLGLALAGVRRASRALSPSYSR